MNAWTQVRVMLFCWNLALVLNGSLARAAQPDAEVDKQEVLRIGDLVQHVGGGHAAPGEQDFVDAMGLPADDNHKWFVSVIGSRSCQYCGKLKADLRTNEYLRALVNVDEPKTSWAHFNWYDSGDKSQAWRWEKIKIAGYPTILVQPPLSKKHGEPSTIVMQQTGYDGDGRKLASKITATIRAYLAKRAQANAGPSPVTVGIRAQAPPSDDPPAKRPVGFRQFTPAPGFDAATVGADPPWTPTPKNDPAPPPSIPAGPLAFPVDFIPTIPPADVPVRPTPKPATPGPNKPAETPDAAEPELIIITDGLAAAADSRVETLLANVRARHKGGLRERILDWRDALNTFNVAPSDLPAVVVTDGQGNVTERITGRTLPLLNPPAQPQAVTIADLPWSSVLALFTGGATIPAAIALGIFALRWIRSRRQASGTAPARPLLDALLAALAKRTEQPPPTPAPDGKTPLDTILDRLFDLLQPKPTPAPPST